jgi:hypothetical protein
MGLGSNDCFVTGAALMDGHYRTDIISGVGHLRSDLVVPLVLYTVIASTHARLIETNFGGITKTREHLVF